MPSRYRIDQLLPEIERLLALGWPLAKIAREVGVSVGTIGAIRAQTRAPKSRPKSDDERAGDVLAQAGAPVGRCPACGQRCRLPCMACALRAPEPPPRDRSHRITSRSPRALLRAAFVAVAWCAAGCLAADEHPLYLRLDNVEVIDGDTIRADIRLGYDVVLARQTIRADNYDAWEKSRARRTVDVTDEEIAAGKRAAADLAELVRTAQHVWLVPGEGREPHGRRLGHWIIDTAEGEEIDVGPWMRRHKHCRPGG